MRYSAKSFRVGAASEVFSFGRPPGRCQGLRPLELRRFHAYILKGARAKRARKTRVKLVGDRRHKSSFFISCFPFSSGLVEDLSGVVTSLGGSLPTYPVTRDAVGYPGGSLMPVGRPLYPRK